MGSAAHRASAIAMPAQHAEHIYQVAQGDTPAVGIEEVATSWQRCANEYGVNPLQNEAPRFSVFSPSSNHQLLCLSGYFLAILPPLVAAVAPSRTTLPPFFRLDYLISVP